MIKKICGVYKITNTKNNKVYIGQSKDIYKRWKQHENNSKNLKLYKNYKIYRAINKYGFDFFVMEILEQYDNNDNNITKQFLLERESFFIEMYNSIKSGYNSALKYDTISLNLNKDEIGKRISENKKNKNNTWINKNGITKCIEMNLLDKFINDGWILGRGECSEIHKKNVSDTLKNKWKNGYTHSDEALKIMSQSFKGKKHTDETKKQMSENSKGKYSLPWFIEKYGELEGNIKYTEKCQKIKDRNMKTGLDWFVSRYGETDGLKYFKYKQDNMKNGYYMWMNNGTDMIIIKKSLKLKYINDGWTIGMLKKIK